VTVDTCAAITHCRWGNQVFQIWCSMWDNLAGSQWFEDVGPCDHHLQQVLSKLNHHSSASKRYEACRNLWLIETTGAASSRKLLTGKTRALIQTRATQSLSCCRLEHLGPDDFPRITVHQHAPVVLTGRRLLTEPSYVIPASVDLRGAWRTTPHGEGYRRSCHRTVRPHNHLTTHGPDRISERHDGASRGLGDIGGER
jgi:hypothetical protein